MKKKLLMIPGPIEFENDVLQAMATPSYSHTDPHFVETFGQALEDLKTVFAAPNGFPIVIPGSGTCAMELAVANVVQPGDRAVVVETGYFSWRLRDILERHGAKTNLVKAAAGKVPSLDAVKTNLAKGAKLLAITHVDTSTGVLAPIKEYAQLAHEAGALVLVDGVCSIGGQELRMEDWGIDVVLTGSQKALAVPAGLALVMASTKALAAFESRKKPVASYYCDWGNWIPIMRAYLARQVAYFGTPAVNNVFALAASLKTILTEGMDARWLRHARVSRAFKAGAAALGLKQIPAKPENQAVTLTTLYYPVGKDASSLKRAGDAGVILAGGLYPDLKTKYLRVGHMGNTGIGEVLQTLSALEAALDLTPGKGVAATQRSWQESVK